MMCVCSHLNTICITNEVDTSIAKIRLLYFSQTENLYKIENKLESQP